MVAGAAQLRGRARGWTRMAPHENPGRRRRRARARARVVSPPQPARRGDLLRARESRHRRGRRLHSDRGRATSSRSPTSPGKLHVDLTVIGPELPLSLGIVDEFIKRQLPIFGPDAPGRADRVVEGVRQGVLQAARHPDRRFGDLLLRGAGAQGDQALRFPGRPQGGRARRRQGRPDRRVRRGRGARAPPLLPGARLRRRRRPDRRRGVPARPGGVVPRPVRRRGLRAAADRARLQEGLRRRPRSEHRRHGRALARRGPERRGRLAGAQGHPVADVPRPAGGGPRLPGRPVRRA